MVIERGRDLAGGQRRHNACREKALMAYNLQDDTIRFVFISALQPEDPRKQVPTGALVYPL